MESLKQAFQKAVPNADERELLRREYGADAITKLYQGVVDLEDDPAIAFAKSLNAQLLIIKSKGQSSRYGAHQEIIDKLNNAQAHAAEYDKIIILPDIVDIAVDMYGAAMWGGSDEHVLELYRRAANLPGQDTRLYLHKTHGLILDGAYYHQPAKSTLLVCLQPGTVPRLLKLCGEDRKTKAEGAIHESCQSIEGVVCPVETMNFGHGSHVSVTKDSVPTIVRAGWGILMPMYAASLDQFRQPIPECDVLRRGVRLKGTLEGMHEKGIWHNDVKPANILVDIEGQWFVGDFGAATWKTQPTERTEFMWQTGMLASPKTDFILLANTLLLVMHKRLWTDPPDVNSLRNAARNIKTKSLRIFVEDLLQ